MWLTVCKCFRKCLQRESSFSVHIYISWACMTSLLLKRSNTANLIRVKKKGGVGVWGGVRWEERLICICIWSGKCKWPKWSDSGGGGWGVEFLSAAICRQAKKSTFSIGRCLLLCQSLRHLMKPPWLSFENSWWCSQPHSERGLVCFFGGSHLSCAAKGLSGGSEKAAGCAPLFSTGKAENRRSRNELSVLRLFHQFFLFRAAVHYGEGRAELLWKTWPSCVVRLL